MDGDRRGGVVVGEERGMVKLGGASARASLPPKPAATIATAPWLYCPHSHPLGLLPRVSFGLK